MKFYLGIFETPEIEKKRNYPILYNYRIFFKFMDISDTGFSDSFGN